MSSRFTSKSSLDPPYGAHITIVTEIQVPTPVSNSTCSLLLHYALPPLLFVDRYELEMRTGEYEVIGLRGKGAKELERPVHALPVLEGFDNDVGVELVVRKEVLGEDLQVRLPIHVRYGESIASDSSSPSKVQQLGPPDVLLTCSDGVPFCSGNAKIPNYLHSFVFNEPYCVAEQSTSQPLEISVPLGNIMDLPIVEFGTSVVILACFAWIVLEAWRASSRIRKAEEKSKSD